METHWLAQIVGIFPDWFWILLAAHAVNTFPTPNNKYGQWVLGTCKWIVGQRVSGANAVNGFQTEVLAVTDRQKLDLQQGGTMTVAKTNGPNSVLKDVDSITTK